MKSLPITDLEPKAVLSLAVAHASEILEERRQRYFRDLRQLCAKMEKWNCVNEARLIRAELAATANAVIAGDDAHGGLSPASTGCRTLDALRLQYVHDQHLVRDQLRIVESTARGRHCGAQPTVWQNFFARFASFVIR